MDVSKTHREGETGNIPERSGRFQKKDGYWYYSTREGVDIGPFDSREDAEHGAEEFVDFINSAEPKAVTLLARHHAA